MSLLFWLWFLIDVRKDMDLMEAEAKLADESCEPGEYIENILTHCHCIPHLKSV